MATGPRLSIECPHCREKASVRSSRAVSPTYKHLNFQCSNLVCGHTFAAALEVLYTIAPSAMPDPEINLRTAPPRTRHAIAANDVGAHGARAPEVAPLIAANDAGGVDEAIDTGT